MTYRPLRLHDILRVEALVSLHYFEFARDYAFAGESHPFWELVYVDKGVAEIVAADRHHTLNQGEIVFHQPDEFHKVGANRKVAPNLIVIAFVCRSRAMFWFRNRLIVLDDEGRRMLSQVVRAGSRVFAGGQENGGYQLRRLPADDRVDEQWMRLHLELLLLHLLRLHGDRSAATGRPALSGPAEDERIAEIDAWLDRRIGETTRISDICREFGMSKTQLVTLYRSRRGKGVIASARDRKIERAKTLIREGRHTISQIADLLGYGTVQSFSRHFHQAEDMSATQYARTLEAVRGELDRL